ncbi:MAG: response regulator [Alphaproteobacteria bacterium]|jgi:FixJ family two-component response regulator|nr:response regulator [Alphaproteobacteria bacterium]
MPNAHQTVHLIDDDLATRIAIDAILRSVGHDVALYDSGLTFLERVTPGQCGCVILDVRLPSLSNKEIARRLDISEPTVKVHAQSVFRKIGARNRTHAAIIAREQGFS